jgi:hypothetical protein
MLNFSTTLIDRILAGAILFCPQDQKFVSDACMHGIIDLRRFVIVENFKDKKGRKMGRVVRCLT